MIGWILAGLAAATAGVALSGKEENQNSNIVFVRCPYCSRNISVNHDKGRNEYICPGCNKKFITIGASAYRIDNNVTNSNNNQTSKQSGDYSWKEVAVTMHEDAPSMDVTPFLSDNFYIGSYLCPSCRRNMYKTVFRVGGEEHISVNGTKHILKRLFTCPHCLSFYAPKEGQRLSVGSVYQFKCGNSENIYLATLNYYNSVGTTQGRPDA